MHEFLSIYSEDIRRRRKTPSTWLTFFLDQVFYEGLGDYIIEASQ